MVTDQTHTRRAFLGTGAVVVAGAALAGCGGPSDQERMDGFLQLSRVVTGVDDLPKPRAPEYLDALNAAALKMTPAQLADAAGYVDGKGPATIDALMASDTWKEPGAEQCARAIAGAWWSGMVVDRYQATHLITYDEALVFGAMPWANPQAQCLGATGVWSKPTPPKSAG